MIIMNVYQYILVKDWKRACVVEFDVYRNEEEVAWSDMKKRSGKRRKR